ncbi:hypothetical protein N7462_007635 [Penicillium macrosclerotiorum]|uniref:uncharacterized protein n=1 Tax=Penicillium macrosclerotiorum TaxID=303699 RepID=UPI0025495C52|nr:uncharacterized protein N7462_007635 [Penicillium macrosclerotiorum]KAJ5679391.1 hypothetical protein N7462_007635 [Penicillium macrosclerotiorum]
MFTPVLFVFSFFTCLCRHVGATFEHNPVEGIITNHVKSFDCPTATRTQLSQHELQAAMNRFAYLFYVKKDVEAAFNQYVATNYVQHNPDILDGRDAAIDGLKPLFSAKENTFKVGTTLRQTVYQLYLYFTQIARVMVGPEYSTIHIKSMTEGQPSYNVFDVYKTIGSCIVEHWDCLEEIVNSTVSDHPYF